MRYHAWLAPVLFGLTFVAAAHEGAKHKPKKLHEAVKEQKDWGIAGDAKSVTRTIQVTMTDNMRFSPAHIEVQQDDTILFVHKNAGKVLHEFVLGTRKELQEHAAMMKKFPGMEHDEPYMAHVNAGKTQRMVWRFNRPGTFDFACLIPGHFEAGMVGTITVVPRDEAKANGNGKPKI
jgi:uncharacterized cupredoxin-like copper-binding protein